MTTGVFVPPDYTSQSGSAYPLGIDAAFAVAARSIAAFAPHAQASPNMTVRVDAGYTLVDLTLSEVAAQSTGTITAPATNPRIDRVVLDRLTGAVSVVTGTEAASPVAPVIPFGKRHCARVLLQTSSTVITNSMITDERVGLWAVDRVLPQSFFYSKDATSTFTSDTTFADVLTGPVVAANDVWHIDFLLSMGTIGSGFDGGGGAKIKITAPTGCSAFCVEGGFSSTAVSGATHNQIIEAQTNNLFSSQHTLTAANFSANTDSLMYQASLRLEVGANAGQVMVQAAQNASHANSLIIVKGSRLIAHRVVPA